MEVYYELYLDNPQRMTFLKRMAEKYGFLFASAASDRHREGQPYATTDGLSFYREYGTGFASEYRERVICRTGSLD